MIAIAAHGMLLPIDVAASSINFSWCSCCAGIVWTIDMDTAVVHADVTVVFRLLNMHGQPGVSFVFLPVLLQLFVVLLIRILQELLELLVRHLPLNDHAMMSASIAECLMLY